MNFWQTLPKPIKILAPMEEVTDVVFRNIVAQCGRPDVFFTEFTNTDGLMSKGRENVIRRLQFSADEHPIVAQIWGNNPQNYFDATKLIVEMGFDGIDINMGCPVRKVVGRGQCSGLINNPTLAKELVLACQEAAGKVPVSVKTRIGFGKIATEDWIGFLLELNLDAITIHGRTAREMSKVPARWDEIAKCVKLRDAMKKNTIIVGNGDVKSYEEIMQKYEEYKVDGVMVGRGIFENPFLFTPNRSLNDLTIEERIDLMLHHASKFIEVWGDTRHFALMKKFFKIYISGLEGASEFRNSLMQCENLEEVKETAEEFLNSKH